MRSKNVLIELRLLNSDKSDKKEGVYGIYYFRGDNEDNVSVQCLSEWIRYLDGNELPYELRYAGDLEFEPISIDKWCDMYTTLTSCQNISTLLSAMKKQISYVRSNKLPDIFGYEGILNNTDDKFLTDLTYVKNSIKNNTEIIGGLIHDVHDILLNIAKMTDMIYLDVDPAAKSIEAVINLESCNH